MKSSLRASYPFGRYLKVWHTRECQAREDATAREGKESTRSKLQKNMVRLDLSLRNFTLQFTSILVLGMVTMFVLEHNNYMQYWHKRFETARIPLTIHNQEREDADRMSSQNEIRRQRILCWIPTSPNNLVERAKSVKDTWGKRCDMLLFFSSTGDATIPVIGLNVKEGRHNLYAKTRASLEYIYQHHLDVDWFLKADDDTYVIMENLRYFLSKLNPSDPHYIGRMFTSYGGYNTGGAGYVFSRETLRVFKRTLYEGGCPRRGGEDTWVARCLRVQDVKPVSTRDSSGRETFFQFGIAPQLIPGRPNDFLSNYSYPLPYKNGPECCSDYPNTFHKVKPEMMYLLEYLIYRVKLRPERNN